MGLSNEEKLKVLEIVKQTPGDTLTAKIKHAKNNNLVSVPPYIDRFKTTPAFLLPLERANTLVFHITKPHHSKISGLLLHGGERAIYDKSSRILRGKHYRE